MLLLFRLPLSELVSLPKVLRLAMPLRCDATSSLMLAVSAVDELLLRRRFAAMDLGSSFPIPLDWLVGVSIVAAVCGVQMIPALSPRCRLPVPCQCE